MNTEIFIEGQRLDLSKDLSTLMNFDIDDVANFAERSTAWSKTIVLPGTSNNNRLFGHIFEVGHANAYDPELPNVGYNFNAAKSAECLIFQDNLQTFKGVLRLLEIISEDGKLEYECQAIGELAGLNVALSSGKLEDLDFSEYDHVYNHTNIINSWDNTPGSGYYYPLIDYGNYSSAKHNWDIKTFRPALYVKEYIDKMFTAADYSYSSALFDTDRFKRLIVPHSKKTFQQLSNPSFTGARSSTDLLVDSTLEEVLSYSSFISNGFSNIYPDIIYNSASTAAFDLTFNFSGVARVATTFSLTTTYYISIYLNDTVIGTTSVKVKTSSYNWEYTFTLSNLSISEGDTLSVKFQKSANLPNTKINLTSASFVATSAATVFNEINIGDNLLAANAIPSNIRQVDFLMSIVRMFNLYVYEDKFDSKLIHITPFVDFYPGEVVDWSYKLNRSKPVRLKPMSQLNAKIYEFKFKPDSDFHNDLYKKRYSEGYGDRIYDSEFEFTAAKKSFEVIFSGTPLVGYLGEDKIYPTIFKRTGSGVDISEEQTDSNIRILQSKKITGVTSWSILNGETTLTSVTSYGYAGHLDDPDAPTNDIHFGAPAELFFTLTTGDLSVNQFNVYWSPYMAEITDKDSKLLTGNFYLTPKDILELDFSKYIHLDGNLFRLNSIKDYNMSEPSDCRVELLKVINSTYTSDTSLLYVDEDYYEAGYVE